jgi:hypothetical protein
MKNNVRGTSFRSARALTAIALASMMLAGGSPATAIPDPGPVWPETSSANRLGSCALERVGHQLVRCDDLTGAGVPAPASIPERAGSRAGAVAPG